MDCKDFEIVSTQYLRGDLTTQEEEKLEKHIDNCLKCRQEFLNLKELWGELGDALSQEPSQNLRNNFYDMLETRQQEESPGFFGKLLKPFGNPLFLKKLTLSAFTLLLGFFCGYLFKDGTSETIILKNQIEDLRQQFSLMLLKEEHSSERLKGVVLTSSLKEPQNSTLQTLLKTLNNDPSSNVRLSAIDALYLFRDKEVVKKGVIDSLEKQSSPMVQLALIDLISEIREKRALKALKSLISKKSVNHQVKRSAAKTAEAFNL